jgi:hypothetical protein
MWPWHFLGISYITCVRYKACYFESLVEHNWLWNVFKCHRKVITLWCIYKFTTHHENVGPKWFSSGAFVFAVCMMHHNIKCMTLAAVSAQYKTTEAEHSRGCHHWTQGQGTCLLTVGCLIFSHPICVSQHCVLAEDIMSIDPLGKQLDFFPLKYVLFD